MALSQNPETKEKGEMLSRLLNPLTDWRFDLLNHEIKDRPDFLFWHPPYADIIRYAGEQYNADEIIRRYGFDPRKSDLSRHANWEDFLKELDYCTIKQFSALEKGGHMAILVGDIKKKRKLYSMILEMSKPVGGWWNDV